MLLKTIHNINIQLLLIAFKRDLTFKQPLVWSSNESSRWEKSFNNKLLISKQNELRVTSIPTEMIEMPRRKASVIQTELQ